MKRLSVGKMVGIAGVLVGGYWLVMALAQPLYRFIVEKKDAFDYVFMLTIVPMMALPGIIAVYYGARLIRTPNERNIKWTLGAGAVFLAMFLWDLLEWLSTSLNTISWTQSVSLLIATLFVIPLYVMACRVVMRSEGMAPRHYSHYLSRGVIFIVAMQLWMIGEELIERYFSKEEMYPWELWSNMRAFAPLLAAWVFYKIVVWATEKIKKAHPVEASPLM